MTFDLESKLWQAPRAALSPSCEGLCAHYSQVQQWSIKTFKDFQKSTPGVHPRRRGRRRAWRARQRVAACWASCRRRWCTRWSRWLPRCAAPPCSAVRPPNVLVWDLCLLPIAGTSAVSARAMSAAVLVNAGQPSGVFPQVLLDDACVQGCEAARSVIGRVLAVLGGELRVPALRFNVRSCQF